MAVSVTVDERVRVALGDEEAAKDVAIDMDTVEDAVASPVAVRVIDGEMDIDAVRESA